MSVGPVNTVTVASWFARYLLAVSLFVILAACAAREATTQTDSATSAPRSATPTRLPEAVRPAEELATVPSPTVRSAAAAESSTPTGIPTAVQSLDAGAGLEPNEVRVTVLRVIDGDTIEVDIAGTPTSVRYIGIDTPETVHPTRGEEPFGREASNANKRMVEGRTVLLVKDVSETDRYGRLLRYVFVEESTGLVFVNLELVRQGFAHASSYPPDVAHQSEFADAERQAREVGLGLWGQTEESTGQGSVTKESTDGNCDPSYPTVCTPPRPPDLDCGEIAFRRFTVLQPDPHRFDGDKDGVGCES